MTQSVQKTLVRLVDDDELFCLSQKFLLETRGIAVRTYQSARQFLEEDDFRVPGCLILDVRMPEMTGLDLQRVLESRRCDLPVIFLTGHADVSMAVHTMRHGASDFLEKPVKPELLIASVQKALEKSLLQEAEKQKKSEAEALFAELTPREREVVTRAALDTPNKVIAAELSISEPTVKMHRANAFAKLGVKSPLEAYRLLSAHGLIREETA